MTPEAFVARLKALSDHRGRLAADVRKLEAAIIITDGQIKEAQHWAQVWQSEAEKAAQPVPAAVAQEAA